MKISFGISQLKEKTPQIVHWISVTGASLITAMAALQALYPQYITEGMIAETAKIVAAIRILGQFLGVKDEPKPTTDEPVPPQQ